MKKRLIFLIPVLLAVLICGCGPLNEANEETGPAEEAVRETEISEETEPGTLTALPASLDPENLSDCTAAVRFERDTFNWRGGCFTAELFEPYYFDAAEVNALKVGDTVNYGDHSLTVSSIAEEGSDRILNEGGDEELDLRAMDGGVYEIMTADDAPEMQDLGDSELVLSPDAVFQDQTAASEETVTLTADEIKLYLEELPEDEASFNEYNTTVEIEEGFVTSIVRVWIP